MTNYLGFIVKADKLITNLGSDGIYVRLHIIRGHKGLDMSSDEYPFKMLPYNDVCTLEFYNKQDDSPTLTKLDIEIDGIYTADDMDNTSLSAATDDNTPSTDIAFDEIMQSIYDNRYIETDRLEYAHLAYSLYHDFTNRQYNIVKHTFDYTYYTDRSLLKMCGISQASEYNEESPDYFLFSGAKIHGGLGLRDTNKEFFTLKAQKFDMQPKNTRLSMAISTIEASQPGTTFGMPCPPDWYD